ncbi:hypothetical protein [Streptomyces sp. NPDC000618]
MVLDPFGGTGTTAAAAKALGAHLVSRGPYKVDWALPQKAGWLTFQAR